MPVDFQDYYATLGVPRDATEADIKKAFRKLARQYHPDVAKDKQAAERKFKEINEAHEVLSDPLKRKKYDQLGAHWKDGRTYQPPPGGPGRGRTEPRDFEFHFGGTGFSDFFEQFFGGGERFGFDENGSESRSFSQAHGPDVEGDLLVTLEEVMRGSLRSLSLQRMSARTGQKETHTFKVRIPAGVHEGQSIRVPGQGGEGMSGGLAGDLFLRVRYAAHPEFRARGADLYYELALAPWDAVLGTTVTVPSLEAPVSVRIPPGTNNAQQLRVRGRGLPKSSSGRERGDLYVVINIQLPKQLSESERALWENLRRVSRFNPQASD